MSQEINPFQPPQADIEPVNMRSEFEDLNSEPRALPARHGAEWISQAWELFKVNPLIWILMLLVSGAIFFGVSLIPIIGFLGTALFPLLVGGWMIGCHRVHTEGELRFEDLFAGFNEHFGPLAIAGLIYLGATIAAMLGAVLVGGLLGGLLAFSLGGDPGAGLLVFILIAALIGSALFVPVLMLIWFAPALIVLHGIAPVDALKMSFFGCLRNVLPFLIYGLICMVLLILGAIPLLLGWLVVYPVSFCAVYTAYRDIYVADA